MKFTIPFNMSAFLSAVHNQIHEPTLGSFVWGYHIGLPVILTGIFKAVRKIHDHTLYTIELLDGDSIDVDGLVPIPGPFLPYVVARDNKVHRVQCVIGDTLTTTHGHEFGFDEVQPVLYHAYDEAKLPSDPDLPNRVREEGV